MFEFIKNILSSPSHNLGAEIDLRLKGEKEKDFLFKEIVASTNPVVWKEKEWKDIRSFPIFDQDGSGSCVAQTIAKLLGILYFLKNNVYVHFSATHVYQRRSNKSAAGMIGINALDIAREGVTLEALVPSQGMTDNAMDSAVIEDYKKEVGKIFKIDNYVVMPTADIETIASTIQTTGKGVMVWFFFNNSEWSREVPVVQDNGLILIGVSTLRHSVTATDFLIHKGQKALVIEDSWGLNTGNKGRRIITEDFFKKRNWFAAYPIDFKFNLPASKPKYTFTKTTQFGQTNDEVKALQDVLKYETLFPSNVESTGYYGAITAKAVYDFQVRYNIASLPELDALQGKHCGNKTIAKLNSLYA